MVVMHSAYYGDNKASDILTTLSSYELNGELGAIISKLQRMMNEYTQELVNNSSFVMFRHHNMLTGKYLVQYDSLHLEHRIEDNCSVYRLTGTRSQLKEERDILSARQAENETRNQKWELEQLSALKRKYEGML